MIFDKRGISGIIETVLIILITIVGVFVLVSVLIPWVQKSLNDESNCMNLRGELGFNEDKSCYDDVNTRLQVKFGQVKLDEIILWLYIDNQYVSYHLKNNSACCTSDTPPININYGNNIRFSNVGGEMNYTVGSKITKAKIAPVVNGKECAELAEEIILERCA